MKKIIIITLFSAIACVSAQAQNVALPSAGFGGSGLLGSLSPSDLTGNVGSGFTSENDGQTAYHSSRNDDFGQANGNYGVVGIVFSTPVTVPVASVTFYDGSFFDGGWFGVNGKGPTGVDNSNPGHISQAALIAPLLQVTTSSNSTWTTVAETNNYVQAMTGTATGVPYADPYPTASKFKLTTSLVDITGIRLIGEVGGYSSGGGGFIGEYEFQVHEAPEPSTYAMLLLSAGALVFIKRWRRQQA